MTSLLPPSVFLAMNLLLSQDRSRADQKKEYCQPVIPSFAAYMWLLRFNDRSFSIRTWFRLDYCHYCTLYQRTFVFGECLQVNMLTIKWSGEICVDVFSQFYKEGNMFLKDMKPNSTSLRLKVRKWEMFYCHVVRWPSFVENNNNNLNWINIYHTKSNNYVHSIKLISCNSITPLLTSHVHLYV